MWIAIVCIGIALVILIFRAARKRETKPDESVSDGQFSAGCCCREERACGSGHIPSSLRPPDLPHGAVHAKRLCSTRVAREEQRIGNSHNPLRRHGWFYRLG